jgi:hypothetical protein
MEVNFKLHGPAALTLKKTSGKSKVVPLEAMRAYRGVEVHLHTFLTNNLVRLGV